MERNEQRPSCRWWLSWALPVLTLLVTGLMSTWVWHADRARLQNAARADFESAAANIVHVLETRMTNYRQLLLSGRGLFDASEDVSREEWQQYVSGQGLEKNFPGLLGISWARWVTKAGRESLIQTTRRQGVPDFDIRPAGKRAGHVVTLLVEPMTEEASRAIGYDMYSEAHRRLAMDRARDTGEPALSSLVYLTVDEPTRLRKAVMLYVPVYKGNVYPHSITTRRAALEGFINAAIRIEDLMQAVFSENGHVGIEIFDGVVADPLHLLFSSQLPGGNDAAAFVIEKRLEIDGRVWTLRLRSLPLNALTARTVRVDLLLGAGWLLAAVLAALVAVLMHMRLRAEKLAVQMSEKARRSAHDMRIIMDHMPAIICYIDGDGTIRYANRRYSEWTGRDGGNKGRQVPVIELIPASVRSLHLEALDRAMTGEPQRYEGLAAEGRMVDVSIIPDRGATHVEGVFVFASDISERKRMEASLHAEKERAEVTLRSIGDAVLVVDIDGRVSYLNPIAETMVEWSSINACGRHVDEVLSLIAGNSGSQRRLNPLALAMGEDRELGVSMDTVLVSRGGRRLAVEHSAAPIHDDQGRVVGGVIVFRDVSEARAMALRMTYLAQHDHLTDLPNRTLLQDRLAQAMIAVQRSGGSIGLLFIDLDRFKHINDSLGHAVGDRLLQQVARRLVATVRDDDTVSRQGGDEFVVLLMRLNDPRDAAWVAQKILRTLADPFRVDEHELHIGASIGISLYPEDGDDLRDLMKQADTAMYHAKNSGRGCYRFFTSEMSQQAHRRLSLERELRHAVAHGALSLHYQPKVDARNGRLTGVEALVRWRLADGSVISPAEFIPLAEETGLIRDIDAWVVREACRQGQVWSCMGWDDLTMAVNLSLARFDPEVMHASLTDALATSGFDPRRLEVELLESEMLRNSGVTHDWIERLKSIGVRVAIDDFGTGYSGLSYLQNFALDTLKIDRSFVSMLEKSGGTRHLVRAIVAMGLALGYRVVAEGVETEDQANILREEGCHDLQGYLFHRPMSADQLTVLLRKLAADDGQ